jgi:putative transposase
MIDPEHDLPITQQAEALGISRSTVYYLPRPVSAEDLWLMRQIDELHLNYPFAGSRMLRDLLGHRGLEVGRRHVRTLMRRMAIKAIYRRPNTSKPAPGRRIYPYLLRGHHAAQSGVGDGYHLHPDGAWFRLSGRTPA